MSQQYRRFFITLVCDRSGFGKNGRTPSGRCVIETRGGKGKVVLSVQDLKPGVMYKGYMVSGTDGGSKGAPFGAIPVDEKGRGELKAEFDPDDIHSGMSIDDVNIIAVLASVGESGPVSPLVGYKDDIVRWKTRFTDLSRAKEARLFKASDETHEMETTIIAAEEAPLEITASVDAVSSIDEETEPAVTDSVEEASTAATSAEEAPLAVASAEEITPDDEHIIHIDEYATEPEASAAASEHTEGGPTLFDAIKRQNTEPHTESCPADTPKDMHEKFRDVTRQFNKELDELKYYSFPQEEVKAASEKKQAEKPVPTVEPPVCEPRCDNKLDYLFDTNTAMAPFGNQDAEYRWVRISVRELALLNVDCWGETCRPFIWSAYKRYNHLILGECGGKRYCLGVPARYGELYGDGKNPDGFGEFRFCDDTKTGRGDYGYWLKTIE